LQINKIKSDKSALAEKERLLDQAKKNIEFEKSSLEK
jgi:hypothetical protein